MSGHGGGGFSTFGHQRGDIVTTHEEVAYGCGRRSTAWSTVAAPYGPSHGLAELVRRSPGRAASRSPPPSPDLTHEGGGLFLARLVNDGETETGTTAGRGRATSSRPGHVRSVPPVAALNGYPARLARLGRELVGMARTGP